MANSFSDSENIDELKKRLEETEAALAEIGSHGLLSARLALESENNFRSLAENAREAICMVDQQGLLVYANPRACDLVGYSLPELLGKPYAYFIDLEDIQTVTELWQSCLDGVATQTYHEIAIKHRSGESIPVELSAACTDWQGKLAVMAFIRDIRSRRQIEQALAWEMQVNASLAELAQALLGSPEITQVSDMVLEKAKSLTSSPYGLVGFIQPQNGEIVLKGDFPKEYSQSSEFIPEKIIHHGDGLLGSVYHTGQSAWSNDYPHDPRHVPLTDIPCPLQRLVAVPAKLNQKMVGLVTVANSITPYSVKHVEALERLADLYALGLQNYWTNQLVQSEARRATELVDLTQNLVASGLNPQTLLQVVAQKAAQSLDATCVILIFNKEHNEIEQKVIFDSDPIICSAIEKAFNQISPPVGNSLVKQVLESQEGVFYPFLDENNWQTFLQSSCRAAVELFGLHSLMIVPIKNDQAMCGVLMAARHKTKDCFTQADYLFLKEIIQRAGLVLINAKLFKELQEQQTLLELKVKERTAEIQAERDFALLVMNSIGQGLTVINDKRQFTYVNPTYAHLIGYKPQEIIGKKPEEFTIAEDHPVLDVHWAKREQQEPSSYVNTLLHRDGSLIPVEISGVPYFKDGLFAGSIAVITDLRIRKQLQEAQVRLQALRELLLTVAQSIIQATESNLDETLNRVLQQVGEFLKVDRSYIFLYDWASQTVANTHEWCAVGVSQQKENLQNIPNRALSEWLISLQKEYIFIPSVAELPPNWEKIKKALEKQSIQSLLVMPISSPSELIGFVGFDSVNEKRVWQEEEIRILTILANHLASFFQRRKAEQDYHDSQSKYRLLAENVSDVIFTIDTQNRFTYVSPSVKNLIGFTVEEVKEIHLIELFEPESYEIVQRYFDQEMNPEKLAEMHPELPITHSVEVEMRCKNGESRWVEVRLNPFFSKNGEVGGMIGSARDISERQQARRELEFMATHDSLTGLPNRILLQDRLEHAIKRADRENTILAVMLLDLDWFKRINDACGHSKGDIVLQEVSQRLLGCLRESDTIARVGGDEFIIILEYLSNPYFAANVAEKLIMATSQPYSIEGATWKMSASVGISLYPLDGGDIDTLLKCADIAMYRAKRHRHTYRFYSQRIKNTSIKNQ